MNVPRLTDAQVSQALRAYLPDRAQAGLRERILEAAETTSQHRALPSFLGALSEADPVTRRWSLLIAAALLVALALAATAAVGALRLLDRDPIQQLSLDPEATPRPEATPLATPTPSVRPRPSGPGPLAWSESRLDEDWPAPVRAEPAGGAIVVPIVPPREVNGQVESAGQHPDGSGDTGSDVFPWVDIHEVGFCQGQSACIFITLVSNHPPVVDPSEQWIAYGVVVDDDGDGVPDRRFGVDNSQVAAPGEDPQRRQWITDLHTRRTVLEDDFGETFFDTFYPDGASGMDGARLSFGADATGGGKIGGLPERYYAWASVIENGRVVATDYAPDVGWLDPSATTTP